jgi:hypothetical protein
VKTIKFLLIFAFLFCIIQNARAQEHVYGNSSIVYDSANNVVRGYSRTELDYDTAAYYTAYVCGSLSANGVEQVRSCHSGFLSASVTTQFSGAPEGADVTSDHYVDMQYFDDENSSYIDDSGYSFLPGYSFPTDTYFYAPGTFTYHQEVSIRVGSTYVQAQKPQVTIEGYSFTPLTITKIGGPNSSTTLKVNVSASDSAAFANANVSVSVTLISGNATLSYYPGQTASLRLSRGSSVEVPFTISTTSQNSYTGQVLFRLHIVNVVDNNTSTDISANITITPGTGLVTNQAGNILQIVP